MKKSCFSLTVGVSIRLYVYYDSEFFRGEGREGLDHVLIDKAKKGNDHAFRLLVEKYRHYIFKIIYGVLRNEKDAEDAAQEVFMKIYFSLPNYKKQGFKTWITRIAVHHAIDLKRKKQRSKEDIREDFIYENASPRGDTPELLLLKKEKQDNVMKHIGELPENYREVIIGFYIKEKSYEQLAKEQQVKIKTIETKLYRARQWMKKHWKEDDFL